MQELQLLSVHQLVVLKKWNKFGVNKPQWYQNTSCTQNQMQSQNPGMWRPAYKQSVSPSADHTRPSDCGRIFSLVARNWLPFSSLSVKNNQHITFTAVMMMPNAWGASCQQTVCSKAAQATRELLGEERFLDLKSAPHTAAFPNCSSSMVGAPTHHSRPTRFAVHLQDTVTPDQSLPSSQVRASKTLLSSILTERKASLLSCSYLCRFLVATPLSK